MIKEQIEALEVQKQNLKVNGFCNIKPFKFKAKGKNIAIKSLSNVDGILKVIVSIDGIEDDFNFRNPPILVPDGTFHDEEFEGRIEKRHNYKEDLKEALKSIISDII